MRKAVITGIGTVNSIGTNVGEFWSASLAGRSGVRRITEFAIPDTMSQIAGVVDDDWANGEPLSASLQSAAGQPDRSLLFALSAAHEALADAGLDSDAVRAMTPGTTGVYVSTAIAHITTMESEFRRGSREGKQQLTRLRSGSAATNSRLGTTNPFFFGSTSAEIARAVGIKHGFATMVTGCTGGVDAVGYALQAIRHGGLDLVITGATEAPITPLVVAAFSQINATSLRNDDPIGASRPFDVDRDGFVLAEGCGILVVESLEYALARGARIYAEIRGFGSVNNCFHMTNMPDSGEPIAAASRQAIDDASAHEDEIDFVNLHGSSTPQNDLAEANALRLLFGARASTVPVTSIKSQTGHSLAAANSIELINSVLSIRDGLIPPTINLHRQDPAVGLEVVANTARKTEVNCALKTSSGFGGIHSSLLVARCQKGTQR